MRNSKYAAIIAALLTVAILSSGCSDVAVMADSWTSGGSNELLPIEAESIEFMHLSGVGAWATNLTLCQDGSFQGHYHDTDMGQIGAGHPNGTEYTCDFRGNFREIRKVNEYTYGMTLGAMETDAPGKQWIEDGVLYITAEPIGMDSGKAFLLYTPDAPLDQLPEDLVFCWQLRYVEEDTNRLNAFALYNEESGCGFFPIPFIHD